MVSVNFSVWFVSLLTFKEIFNCTVDPNKSPWSVAFCICAKVTVTFTASFPIGKSLATPLPLLVHGTEIKPDRGLCDCCIPGICSWFPVPKRGVKLTFWKLKSEVWGFVLLASDWRIAVSSKNISFSAALLYSVDVLSVIPAFDGVAKPSISPSERRSKIVANCLLFKVSGALVGDGEKEEDHQNL